MKIVRLKNLDVYGMYIMYVVHTLHTFKLHIHASPQITCIATVKNFIYIQRRQAELWIINFRTENV